MSKFIVTLIKMMLEVYVYKIAIDKINLITNKHKRKDYSDTILVI